MANGRPNRPIRPRGGGAGGRKRRVVIDSGGQRPRPGDQRQRGGGRSDGGKREQQQQVAQPTGPVTVESGVTVRDLSQALGVPMPEIIKVLMGLGQMRTATQSLSDEEVELIAAELEREVTIKHAADEDEEAPTFDDPEEALEARPPVVTIMGHVDHGKTTLLDAIRKTAVVETEAGGITQHIGAYQTDVDGRKITFLDTPGHEAFTAMRARGAKSTDIAVLVVAADDGVMPQTKESISHARAAEVPIVVAVNKIDLPDANPDRVLNELAQEGLQPEEWGGDIADRARLREAGGEPRRPARADPARRRRRARPAREPERGRLRHRDRVAPRRRPRPVATVLVQRGTLHVGDAIVAGDAWGRVRALYDYRGEKVKEARPGDPVEVVGFDKAPPSGELARVVDNERHARQLANSRAERLRREQLATRARRRVSLEGLFEQIEAGGVQELNLVLKADVQGSVEAAVSELAKIQHSEVRVNVIHTGVGGITANDVNLAAASDALVVGFNVRPERRGAPARRARGRRDPHLPRHLPAHAGDRAGARRHARRGHDRGDDRRGRGAAAVQGLAARHDRRLHGHRRRRPPQRPGAPRPRRHGHRRDRHRPAPPLQGRRPRGRRRASSAGSCSRTTTTCARATSSRSTRRARSSGRRSTSRRPRAPAQRRPRARPRAMGAGYVGILSCELHFPASHSLKEKRHFLRSAKQRLMNMGCRGRRGRPPRRLAALADRRSPGRRAGSTRELERMLDEAERFLGGQEWELGAVERRWSIPMSSGRMRRVDESDPPGARRGDRAAQGPADRLRHGHRRADDVRPQAGDRLRQRARRTSASASGRWPGPRGGARRPPGADRARAAAEARPRSSTFEYDPSVERGVRMTKTDR